MAGTLALLVLPVLWPAAVAAQDAGAREIERIQEAAQREAAGDFASAARVLLEILSERPASAPALLALERVLRVEGRTATLPPLVERALAEEPESALLHQLLLRTYSALDRTADLERAGARWMAASPAVEIPYRELARVWADRGDYDRSRRVLEEGRARVGTTDALALELGELYARLGEPELAAREWDRAIGAAGRGLSPVRRALRSLPDGGAAVLPSLTERLATGSPAPARRAAAAELAVAAGLEDRALGAAAEVVAGRDSASARRYLIELARRAEATRASRVAYWAYGELVRRGGEGGEGELLAVRSRYAELALEVGDTAGAAAQYLGMEADLEEGSAGRRRAAALRIELLAGQDPVSAARELRAFRDQNGDAEELDRVAAAVATALLGADAPDEAAASLRGVRGPRSAALRGQLALGRGELETARREYMAAAAGLRGGEATRVLSLVTIIGRVSEAAGALLGDALAGVTDGEVGAALDRLLSGAASLPGADRAALLEFAAGLADEHDLSADARRLRRIIVADHPRTGHAPAALLALARGVRDEPGGAGEARELLERLIIEYPRSALAPQARRELEQLRTDVASTRDRRTGN